MNIDSFLEDVNNISGLSDLPNTEEGLTSAQLKAKFDKAGADIKDYINNTLVPQLEIYGAYTFTVTFPSGQTTYEYITTNDNISSSTNIFCQPDEDSQSLWNEHKVKCSSVSDQKLTFTASSAPTADVTINVFAIN